jgi:peptide/nickel transport system substrate-binding protein
LTRNAIPQSVATFHSERARRITSTALQSCPFELAMEEMPDQSSVLVPIRGIGKALDNDDPNYLAGLPDIYVVLALAYDAMAAPTGRRGGDGVWTSDYATMEPRLAKSWREERDGSWTVELRSGVRSHAGNEFTSDDLAWGFGKAFATRNMAHWRWHEVVGVERVEPLGRHSVRFHLRAPYPTFPNWLFSVTPNVTDSVVQKPHATKDDPWAISWLNRNVAGFGPYAISDLDSEHIRFEARGDYWMGQPDTARIEAARWPDRKSAIRQLDEKRPVVIVGPDVDELAPLLKKNDLQIQRAWAGHVSVEIDFTADQFADRRVRHALAFATPYDRLLADGLLGMARPWQSPIKRVSQWYTASHRFHYDPKQARKLLAEAGQANGFASDLYIPMRPDCQRMAEIIAEAWRDIGVVLTIKDIAKAPAGWMPPLHLRTECAHNMSEPLYDIAHDYAVMDPILPLPGGPPSVGSWKPRYKQNPEALQAFAVTLMEHDPVAKHDRCVHLQDYLVDFSSSIFIGEVQQVLVANSLVSPELIAPTSRFFQALQYQNCSSNYLPDRA